MDVAANQEPRGGQATILVLDDEQGPREAIRQALKDLAPILTTGSAREAVRWAAAGRVSVALVDVHMAEMDGIAVLRQLREVNPTLRVIIYSGWGTHEIARRALALGAVDFLAKPFHLPRVREQVREALREGPAAGASGVLTEGESQWAEQLLQAEHLSALKSLVTTLDARDPHTQRHSKRVARFAIRCGRQLGLTEEELDVLQQTALLHDIGKIGVPDHVLTKPGRLTPVEWEAMRRHPEIGAAILAPFKLLHIEQAVIRHHHERWDGLGYPDRLAGTEIPLYARILSVADAYDAIVSGRVYAPARPVQQALEELQREAGHQFDPSVVVAFVTAALLARNGPGAKGRNDDETGEGEAPGH